ncbi:MAG TPA: hypothetical protein VFC31_09235 [Candidatus Limnocylindria bacterium]|nr:hypothetical protein [Candidatus Limnocylindria bacterium]
MRIPWIVPWIIAPAIVGVALGAVVDVTSLPFVGTERISAVFFTDGQAYFGHLDDSALSGTLTLRDVYYLGDAKGRGTDYDASVVRRGTEVHQPADGMRIRRDKVLVIERVGLGSPVGRAIAAQRALERASTK